MARSSPIDIAPLLRPRARTLVGVIHLPPLLGPGSLDVDAIVARAAADARAYATAGFDAVIVENLGDVPYPKDRSDPHVAAILARAVAAARDAGAPVGVNVLRNDARSALAACHAGGGSFIRVNVLVGAAVTDQGIIEGDAYGVSRYRSLLGRDSGPNKIHILADIDVKHATQLGPRPLDQVAEDAVRRAGADVLLVTGGGTGRAADLSDVEQASRGAPNTPVWVASGVTPKTLTEILDVADGVIIGTTAKRGGEVTAEVDPARAAELAQAAGKKTRSG